MDETGRWKVEPLLEEGWQLIREGRFAEALRAFEKAVDGARELGDLGLGVKAVSWEANALSALGDDAAALVRYTWILAISTDPSRRAEVEWAGVSWEITTAYRQWVQCARLLDEVPVEQLFGVLWANRPRLVGARSSAEALEKGSLGPLDARRFDHLLDRLHLLRITPERHRAAS